MNTRAWETSHERVCVRSEAWFAFWTRDTASLQYLHLSRVISGCRFEIREMSAKFKPLVVRFKGITSASVSLVHSLYHLRLIKQKYQPSAELKIDLNGNDTDVLFHTPTAVSHAAPLFVFSFIPIIGNLALPIAVTAPALSPISWLSCSHFCDVMQKSIQISAESSSWIDRLEKMAIPTFYRRKMLQYGSNADRVIQDSKNRAGQHLVELLIEDSVCCFVFPIYV